MKKFGRWRFNPVTGKILKRRKRKSTKLNTKRKTKKAKYSRLSMWKVKSYDTGEHIGNYAAMDELQAKRQAKVDAPYIPISDMFGIKI